MSGITDRRRVMSKTILYETLTVTVSGLSSGFTIYVINAATGATIDATNSTSSTYEIEEGIRYYVSASSVSGYDKPANSSTYTAVGNNSRTISIRYSKLHTGTKNPSQGVWIQDIDGYCHSASEWTGEYTPNGIAIVDWSNHSFVISLDMEVQDAWSSLFNEISGLNYVTSQRAAESVKSGKISTDYIISALGSYATAANYCYNYVFPNGKRGYLGGSGEWYEAQLRYSGIMEAYDALNSKGGHTYYSKMTDGSYWTSTLGNDNYVSLNLYAWRCEFYRSSYSVMNYSTKDSYHWILPFTTL